MQLCPLFRFVVTREATGCVRMVRGQRGEAHAVSANKRVSNFMSRVCDPRQILSLAHTHTQCGLAAKTGSPGS